MYPASHRMSWLRKDGLCSCYWDVGCYSEGYHDRKSGRQGIEEEWKIWYDHELLRGLSLSLQHRGMTMVFLHWSIAYSMIRSYLFDYSVQERVLKGRAFSFAIKA